MDQTRRNTLKALSATGMGIAISTIAPLATANTLANLNTKNALNLNDFTVQIEHAWGGTDASVVIKNTSGHASTITRISPSYLSAEPGLFDFGKATQDGPLTLAADEELRIPFTPMASPAATIGHFDHSIQKRLRETLTIQTDQLRIAKTSTTLNPRIV